MKLDNIDIKFVVINPDNYEEEEELKEKINVHLGILSFDKDKIFKELELDIVKLLNSFDDFKYCLSVLKTSIITKQYDYVDLLICDLYDDQWFSETFKYLESIRVEQSNSIFKIWDNTVDSNINYATKLFDIYLKRLKSLSKYLDIVKECVENKYPTVIWEIDNILNIINMAKDELQIELVYLHGDNKEIGGE